MVYIIGGLPGAGKSTYSKTLAKKVKGIVFATDVWMSELFWMDKSPGEDLQWALERTDRCEKRMMRTCAQLNEIDVSSVLDIGFVNLKWRQKAYDLLNSLGVDFEVHFLDVDKETRWKRVQKRNSEKGDTFSFEVTRDMFDFMDQHYDPIDEHEMTGKLVRVQN
ncbi:MAG: ATP-binding protein [Bdellovibrionales bacterium]|nr:ATP-binding protein [Bdellovibrionales bacterium]